MRFPRSRRATAILAMVLALLIGGGTAATMAIGGIGDRRDANIPYVHDGDRYDDCDGYRDEDDDC